MVAVPNNFTRNQLEVRFRADIEGSLTGYYAAPIKLVGDGRRHPAGARAADQGYDAGAEFGDYGGRWRSWTRGRTRVTGEPESTERASAAAR